MLQNSKIRNKALEALDGNWGSSAIMTFVYVAIVGILTSVGSIAFTKLGLTYTYTSVVEGNYISQEIEPFSEFLAILLVPMSFAMTVTFLGLVRGAAVGAGCLFKYYKQGKVWALVILTGIYTMLWALLLIIPGIIKSYSYSMASYIMKDNPEISADAAICESMKMMKGYKMKLFLLDLSFIGWAILALLTLGLGFLLLEPYVLTARAVFYEELKAERGMVIEEA